jgi:hypothetical protein
MVVSLDYSQYSPPLVRREMMGMSWRWTSPYGDMCWGRMMTEEHTRHPPADMQSRPYHYPSCFFAP